MSESRKITFFRTGTLAESFTRRNLGHLRLLSRKPHGNAGWSRGSSISGSSSMFNGRHFDRSVILLCARWCLAYNLSLRDLEEMMAERGFTSTTPRFIAGSSADPWLLRSSPRETTVHRCELPELRCPISCDRGSGFRSHRRSVLDFDQSGFLLGAVGFCVFNGENVSCRNKF